MRIGDTVRRPTGPWTETIHAYLRHIRTHGFAGAPDPLGIDERGREILTYIAGETWGDSIDPDEPKTELVVLRPWAAATRSEESLVAVGRMYAELHRAAQGFRPPAPVWREYGYPMADDEIVCHGDAGPWNVVWHGAQPVALIDWDNARPARPLDDLAGVAWHFVPLGPDDIVRASGFDESFDVGHRLRILCDAYGLADRDAIVPSLAKVKQLGASVLRYWQPLRPGAAARWLLTIVRDLEWLEAHTPELKDALV